MVTQGETVNVETWQGQDVRSRPDMVTTELFNVTVEVPLRGLRSLNHWRAEIGPNLPWADDHFAERVSGKPLNPPPSWAWWPWAQSAAKHRDPNEKFNHSYPERFWPKKAHLNWNDPMGIGDCALSGIHQEYGDLDDVVMLLRKDPQTRQAFFPIFFPEDTGVGDGGRKPCTLGYQFLRRGAQLHVVYSMRSCDLVRHYSDDVYLTVRLLLWVLEQCGWTDVKPGTFVMHMTSLHIFANDLTALQSEQSANLMKALS
jgi:hypothetical protein